MNFIIFIFFSVGIMSIEFLLFFYVMYSLLGWGVELLFVFVSLGCWVVIFLGVDVVDLLLVSLVIWNFEVYFFKF